MKEEFELISPLTRYRASFVASFGYDCKLVEKADNYLDDRMRIVTPKSSHVVSRKGLFEFIQRRHPVVQTSKKPELYVIEHPNWFESLRYI